MKLADIEGKTFYSEFKIGDKLWSRKKARLKNGIITRFERCPGYENKVYTTLLKIEKPENSNFVVSLNSGEVLSVNAKRGGCIANVQSAFNALGFKAYATFMPKEGFEKWAKRWSKKALTYNY